MDSLIGWVGLVVFSVSIALGMVYGLIRFGIFMALGA